MKIKKSHIIYGILLVVFLLSIIPWMKEGVPATDDYRHHAVRMWFLEQQITNAEYSEWMPNLYGGWPFLHFYHPMFYIISIPAALVFSAILSLKIMTMIAFAIALFGTFYGAKTLLKDDEIALVAAVAYMLSSHFLFHATVSGALPRLTAIALAPLVMCFFIKSLEEDKKKITIITGILMALLLMMHVSIAIPVFIVCGVYVLYKLYLSKNKKALITPIIAVLILIGLSAAWVFPMLIEKEYGNFPNGGAKLEAPSIKQTLRTFGITHDGERYIRSNYFGYATFALALLSLIFIRNNKTVNFLKIGFIASLIMYFNMLGLLNIIPFMKTVLLGGTSFFASALVFNAVMLAGVGAKSVAKTLKKNYLIYIILLVIIIELYPGLNAFSYKWFDQDTENFVNPPQLVEAWKIIGNQDGDFTVFSAVGQGAVIYHGKNEFGYDWVGCPQCTQKKTYQIHNEIWKNFTNGIKDDSVLGYLGVKYYVVPCQNELPNTLVFQNGVCVYENEEFRPIIESNAEISNVEKEFDKIAFKTESEKEEQVIIKINYFKPHWKAYVNGKQTEIKETWPEFMLITAPAGENNIVIDYRTNILHVFSWLITIIAIILVIYFLRK